MDYNARRSTCTFSLSTHAESALQRDSSFLLFRYTLLLAPSGCWCVPRYAPTD